MPVDDGKDGRYWSQGSVCNKAAFTTIGSLVASRGTRTGPVLERKLGMSFWSEPEVLL